MDTINRESILNKTHYGLGIYSHILRQYYPDDIVFRLAGRDCGLCRNPFNTNKESLHIYIKKSDPANVMSKEFAIHEDNENAIPPGDAFNFAELHYKQQGNDLLHTLNKEMLLHIGEEQNFYNSRICPQRPIVDVVNIVHIDEKKPIVDTPSFSFFKSPITNTTPHSQTTLRQIYNVIKGNYYKARTEKLRSLLTSPLSCGEGSGERSGEGQVVRQKFKAANFDYCTFSGTFTSRNDKALIKHSGLLCIDFDHINSVETLFNHLLQDDYFDTQLLFRSPSGDGLKWIISIDVAKVAHVDYFLSISNYIKATYGIAVDKSGRDLSRACFLPFDPQAYINPIHLKQS